MGDIWLPGLPPAYSSFAECLRYLEPLMPTHDDAVILAAIAYPESGFDYRVINDTPATGDYSVGLFEINYYADLYPSRAAAYGTPRELILSGPKGQCHAAADLWHSAGGFSPWAADIISGSWRAGVGAGPVPASPGLGSAGGIVNGIDQANAMLTAESHEVARAYRAWVDTGQWFGSLLRGGWRP